MSSAIHDLQRAAVSGQQSLTQLLRQMKLIAAKLNLDDVERWVDLELGGYPKGTEVPSYRRVFTHSLEIHNPYQGGWRFAGNLNYDLDASQPIAEIENYSKGHGVAFPMPENLPIQDTLGSGMFANFPQRFIVAGSQYKRVVDGVIDKLIQITTELEKKGIKGESMNFDEKEKQLATNVHIDKFTGVFGNVTNSQVAVNDYSSICKLLIDQNVPKMERREFEDILEELKTAPPEKKKGLIAKAESWMVKHGETLGTGAEIVGKFIKGLSGHDSPTQPH